MALQPQSVDTLESNALKMHLQPICLKIDFCLDNKLDAGYHRPSSSNISFYQERKNPEQSKSILVIPKIDGSRF